MFAYIFLEIIHLFWSRQNKFCKIFYIHLIFLYELYISNSMEPGQTAKKQSDQWS